jgi:Diguanylate cyclase, GGDEF domain
VARYDGSAAIVFIDLDHFKCINDQFGHLAGDAALQAVSEMIVRSCRNSDLVALRRRRVRGASVEPDRTRRPRQSTLTRAKHRVAANSAGSGLRLGGCVGRSRHALRLGFRQSNHRPRRCRHVLPENGQKISARLRVRRPARGLITTTRSAPAAPAFAGTPRARFFLRPRRRPSVTRCRFPSAC